MFTFDEAINLCREGHWMALRKWELNEYLAVGDDGNIHRYRMEYIEGTFTPVIYDRHYHLKGDKYKPTRDRHPEWEIISDIWHMPGSIPCREAMRMLRDGEVLELYERHESYLASWELDFVRPDGVAKYIVIEGVDLCYDGVGERVDDYCVFFRSDDEALALPYQREKSREVFIAKNSGKKYALYGTGEDGLHRIRALRDIPRHGVRAGDLGGLVEGEHNLSQDGDCWITYTSQVCQTAKVSGNKIICGGMIIDNSTVYYRCKVPVYIGNDGAAMIGCGCNYIQDWFRYYRDGFYDKHVAALDLSNEDIDEIIDILKKHRKPV